MSSRELAEWKAYERVSGPLGTSWFADVIAGLHEQLQGIAYLLSQANFTDKNHRTGPVPQPKDYPRPHALYATAVEADEAKWHSQEIVPLSYDNEDEDHDEVRT